MSWWHMFAWIVYYLVRDGVCDTTKREEARYRRFHNFSFGRVNRDARLDQKRNINVWLLGLQCSSR